MSLHSRLYGGRCTAALMRVHGSEKRIVYVSPDGARIPVRAIVGAEKGLQESDGLGGREKHLELDVLIPSADLFEHDVRSLQANATVEIDQREWTVEVQRSAMSDHQTHLNLSYVELIEENSQRVGGDGSV